MQNKTELREIKAGQTGTGLLIENDGYLSLNEGPGKILYESILSEREINKDFFVPKPFIVPALFQKFGIKNQNGRIYPEHVLKREVEKYQQKIKDREAFGECYKPDTLILTESGWKELNDVVEGDNILTLNPETNEIEIKPIKKVVRYQYDGDMIRIKGRNINDLVTPEHGYPIYNQNNKFKNFYTAQNIFDKSIKGQNHSFIPKQGVWKEIGEEFMIIDAIDNEHLKTIPRKDLKEKYSEPLVIPMDIFAKFMGIYLSEGSHSKTKSYKINIHQKKKDIIEEIIKMFDEWGINYAINWSKNESATFVISDMRLHKYVSQFGLCYNKYVPHILKQQSKEILTIFYDWFVMGDGRVRGHGKYKNTTDVFSTSKRLVMDLNEIQLKIGYSGNYHVELRNNDREIIENGVPRTIKGENTHPLYFTYKSLVKGIYLDERFIETSKEYYNGDVMCVEVDNHIWYTMCGDKCHWTKNCNHPAESTIDLSRICMNITKLYWEGSTLLGEMEVEVSEGFRRHGIISCQGDIVAHHLLNNLRIGVSSRGLGSVENKYGTMLVCDDFELICWDVVATPSSPGAWIAKNPQDLAIYIENTTPINNNTLFEKLEKFTNIL